MAGKRATALQADEEAVVALQAVVLADTFAQNFRPITLERSKVLLPLVNVPMIDYTLEWLSTAGVEEVFVFCCANSSQVTSHVDHYWKGQPGFKVTCIVAMDCVSAGDALRLIDQKGVIRSDFVLVTGDTVSNMSLEEPLREHRERRKREKQAVMTMVTQACKTDPVTRQTRLGIDEHVYAVNPETQQLLHYDPGREFGSRGSHRGAAPVVALDKALLQEHGAVELHTDWQDCHVDICSPEVLLLFTDNFDYQHVRRDFVKGLLNDDIMGNKIFVYELKTGYAARVDNLRSYDVVSRDIIHRFPYPHLPDTQFGSHSNVVQLGRGNKYKEKHVQLARTAIVGENTSIGEGTLIGDSSTISESVIGRNCVIGNGVLIERSYIWSNVTLEDGAQISNAVICDGAVVKAGGVVEPGSVLSFQVVIGPGFRVPAYSKISLQPQPLEEDSSDEELEYSEPGSARSGLHAEDEAPLDSQQAEASGRAVSSGRSQLWKADEVGADGAGFKWWPKDEGPHEEEWRHSVAPIPAKRLQELQARQVQGAVEEARKDSGEGLTGAKAQLEADEEEEEEDEDEEDEFAAEVHELFQRTVHEGANFDNIVLEISALKLGMVRTFADCAQAVFRSMLSLVLERAGSPAGKGIMVHVREVLIKWGPLLRRFLKEQDDEVEVLLTFEEECAEGKRAFAPHFATMLQLMYERDLVTEEAILAWAEEKKFADEADKAFLKQSARFLQWLQEAEEEDSEEEEEEEEEQEEKEGEDEDDDEGEEEGRAAPAPIPNPEPSPKASSSPEAAGPSPQAESTESTVSEREEAASGPRSGSDAAKASELKSDPDASTPESDDDEILDDLAREGDDKDGEDIESSSWGGQSNPGDSIRGRREDSMAEASDSLPPASVDFEVSYMVSPDGRKEDGQGGGDGRESGER